MKDFYFHTRVISIEIISTDSSMPHLYPYETVLHRKNDSVLHTGVDSRWAVKMEIVSVTGAGNILKAGETVTFLIHSPVKLFLCPAPAAVHKTFSLRLRMTRHEDDLVSFDLFLQEFETNNHL